MIKVMKNTTKFISRVNERLSMTTQSKSPQKAFNKTQIKAKDLMLLPSYFWLSNCKHSKLTEAFSKTRKCQFDLEATLGPNKEPKDPTGVARETLLISKIVVFIQSRIWNRSGLVRSHRKRIHCFNGSFACGGRGGGIPLIASRNGSHAAFFSSYFQRRAAATVAITSCILAWSHR